MRNPWGLGFLYAPWRLGISSRLSFQGLGPGTLPDTKSFRAFSTDKLNCTHKTFSTAHNKFSNHRRCIHAAHQLVCRNIFKEKVSPMIQIKVTICSSTEQSIHQQERIPNNNSTIKRSTPAHNAAKSSQKQQQAESYSNRKTKLHLNPHGSSPDSFDSNSNCQTNAMAGHYTQVL